MTIRRGPRLVLSLGLVLLASACTGNGDNGNGGLAGQPPSAKTIEPAMTATAPPQAGPTQAIQSLTLTPAFGGRRFSKPVEMAPYPGGRLFVADQDGLVSLLRPDGADAGSLLDMRGRVLRSGQEEGLLSVALDPDFARNSYLYAYYSAGGPRRSVLSRFHVENDAAVPSSELVILEIGQPFPNHNGGAIRFGPDGMLYLSLGDGGSGGDPMGNGQRLDTLLGKIIRIDVRDAAAGRPYAIPPDNPFVGRAGARGEIWAFGLRNPWRMAFDPVTQQLWAADVGQNAVEEIDIIEKGGNYGWNRLEGDRCYPAGASCNPNGTILPVATYDHSMGCSVTGGFVVRGGEQTALRGYYVYADFCSGRIWALPADRSGGPREIAGQDTSRSIASIAMDGDGNVYFLVHGGPILRVAAVA